MTIRTSRFLTCVLMTIVSVAAATSAQPASAAGPEFSGPFKQRYLGATDLVNAAGSGCPSTGGPPTATPPGVFVSLIVDGASEMPVNMSVSNGQVVFDTDSPPYPWMGVYFAVQPDGSWSGTISPGIDGATPFQLKGVCTTLIALAPGGQSVDPASITAATFVSPSIEVVGVPYTTTSSSRPSLSTSSTTSTPVGPTSTVQAVSVAPRFTG